MLKWVVCVYQTLHTHEHTHTKHTHAHTHTHQEHDLLHDTYKTSCQDHITIGYLQTPAKYSSSHHRFYLSPHHLICSSLHQFASLVCWWKTSRNHGTRGPLNTDLGTRDVHGTSIPDNGPRSKEAFHAILNFINYECIGTMTWNVPLL